MDFRIYIYMYMQTSVREKKKSFATSMALTSSPTNLQWIHKAMPNCCFWVIIFDMPSSIPTVFICYPHSETFLSIADLVLELWKAREEIELNLSCHPRLLRSNIVFVRFYLSLLVASIKRRIIWYKKQFGGETNKRVSHLQWLP